METETDATSWSRPRLIGILATALVIAVILLIGLTYSLGAAVRSINSDQPTGEHHREGEERLAAAGPGRRDQIASSPMLKVPADAMSPAAPAAEGTDRPTPIQVPAGDLVGPASVVTGFPQTPEGAVGQLAQIEATVLQSMSLATAEQVHAAWALPGGVAADDWGLTLSVRAFLTSTAMGESTDAAATVTVEPVAGQIKGVDGDAWVTACVLMKVTATYRSEAQVAYGYCERMQWAGGRWMLAPGIPPAAAPSTWPGTTAAYDAGWRSWAGPSADPAAGPASGPGNHIHTEE